MRLFFWVLIGPVTILAASCQGSKDAVVVLSSGDSVVVVEVSRTTPIHGPQAFMIRYHPFMSLTDTARLKRLTVVLWKSLNLRLDTSNASVVVIQATSELPGPRWGFSNVTTY